MRSALLCLLLALPLSPGCADDQGAELAKASQARQDQAEAQENMKKELAQLNEKTLADDKASLGKPEGRPDRPSPFVDRSCQLTVSASFSDLPAGARVIAASARDGRFQKVTRSEHSGVSGAVMPAEDGHNLFFVSDAVTAGTFAYEAKYEITRRVGTQGSLDMARGATWQSDAPAITDASTDAALTKLAGELGAEEAKPYALLMAAMATAMKSEIDAEGSDSPVTVAAGNKASPQGAASLLSEVLKVRGVPARVMQGLQRSHLEGDLKVSHAWAEVKLPGLSWVPVDPALRRRHTGEEDDPTFLGTVPADRITFVVGHEAVLAEDGTLPRTTLSGDLVAPFAVLDGKRVGKVTWTAVFKPQAAATK